MRHKVATPQGQQQWQLAMSSSSSRTLGAPSHLEATSCSSMWRLAESSSSRRITPFTISSRRRPGCSCSNTQQHAHTEAAAVLFAYVTDACCAVVMLCHAVLHYHRHTGEPEAHQDCAAACQVQDHLCHQEGWSPRAQERGQGGWQLQARPEGVFGNMWLGTVCGLPRTAGTCDCGQHIGSHTHCVAVRTFMLFGSQQV